MRLAVTDSKGTNIAAPVVQGGGTRSSVDEHVRTELARELHDQVVQELTATLVDLENFKRRPYDQQAVEDEVVQVQGSLRRALHELRQLLYDLRDEDAWQASFMSSLQDFARRYNERRAVHVNVVADGDWPSSIRSAAAKHLQRIIHEAVNNARLHGGARSVLVSLLAESDLARVTILDDGQGMDPDLGEESGMGILGMRERALLLGGSITVERGPDQGTLVRLDFPRSVLA
jgi:two-component system sensor histidine kinase DegS